MLHPQTSNAPFRPEAGRFLFRGFGGFPGATQARQRGLGQGPGDDTWPPFTDVVPESCGSWLAWRRVNTTTPAGCHGVDSATTAIPEPSQSYPSPIPEPSLPVKRPPATGDELADTGFFSLLAGTRPPRPGLSGGRFPEEARQLESAPSAVAFWVKMSLSLSVVTRIGSPSCRWPRRISSASGSSRNRSTARRIGRAPYCGS
jgi:hypothetical protein